MNKYVAALSISLLAVGVATAAPFMVLNRMIELVPPTGYCAIGKTARQKELLEQQKTRSEFAGDLLQIAVPCEELKQFDIGFVDGFTRQAIVMTVKTRGQLKLDNRSHSEFLHSLSSEPTVDITNTNNRLRATLAQQNYPVTLQTMTLIGSDGTAIYWSIIGEVQLEGDVRKKVASVMAALLINNLRLSIQVSEQEGASNGPAPATVAQKYVQSIIIRN